MCDRKKILEMTAITYNVPLVLTPEDNNTEIAKTLIMVKSCNSFDNPNENCDGFNFNLCPNDRKYCQPFIKGDKIYCQLAYDIKKYFISGISLIDTSTDTDKYIASNFTFQSGHDPLNNYFFNYILDTGADTFASDITCFYFKLQLTPRQGGDFVYVYSEPYCLVKCNENTMLITGEYPNGYDCSGGYHGTMTGGINPGASIYTPSFRIRGVLEPENFDFEKTENHGKFVKSKQFERFFFRLEPTPYYVARQIAVCFNSKKVTIDGDEYKGTVRLQKNFDEGSMWISNETIYRDCDELNFTCDT